jgi:hypothetical protein
VEGAAVWNRIATAIFTLQSTEGKTMHKGLLRFRIPLVACL